MRMTEQPNAARGDEAQRNRVEAVPKQVSSLRFGLIQIVVHNSRVAQIEKTERIRFDQANANEFIADQNTGGSK